MPFSDLWDASLPHMISTNFQKMAAIALELEYEMPALKALNIQ